MLDAAGRDILQMNKIDVLFLLEAVMERYVAKESDLGDVFDGIALKGTSLTSLAKFYRDAHDLYYHVPSNGWFLPAKTGFAPSSTIFEAQSISNDGCIDAVQGRPPATVVPIFSDLSYLSGTPINSRDLLRRMYYDLKGFGNGLFYAPGNVNEETGDPYGGYYAEIDISYFWRQYYGDRLDAEGNGSGIVADRCSVPDDSSKLEFTVTDIYYYRDRTDTVTRTVSMNSFDEWYFSRSPATSSPGGKTSSVTYQKPQSVKYSLRIDADELYLVIWGALFDFDDNQSVYYPTYFCWLEPLVKESTPREGYVSTWTLTPSSGSVGPITYEKALAFAQAHGASHFRLQLQISYPLFYIPKTFRTNMNGINWNWTPPSE